MQLVIIRYNSFDKRENNYENFICRKWYVRIEK